MASKVQKMIQGTTQQNQVCMQVFRAITGKNSRVLLQMALGGDTNYIGALLIAQALKTHAAVGKPIVYIATSQKNLMQTKAFLDQSGISTCTWTKPADVQDLDANSSVLMMTARVACKQTATPPAAGSVVILDEAHHATTPTYQNLFVTKTYTKCIIIGVTNEAFGAALDELSTVFDTVIRGPGKSWNLLFSLPACDLRDMNSAVSPCEANPEFTAMLNRQTAEAMARQKQTHSQN